MVKYITRYKGHKIESLDGSLNGRLYVTGPKVNHIFYGGGLEVIIKWIDSTK